MVARHQARRSETPKGIAAAVFVFVFGTALLFVIVTAFNKPCGRSQIVLVGGKSFCVELAHTAKAWETGLSGREDLLYGHGMLFVFPDRNSRTFWMKGMRFPLDMIWIRDRSVVGFETRVAADGGARQIVTPPVDAVLEVNAGEVDRLGVHIGDTSSIVPP